MKAFFMIKSCLIIFLMAACAQSAPDNPTALEITSQNKDLMKTAAHASGSDALYRENKVTISDHLDGVIFGARFLDIPTYEGSGQTVHPQVLFFEEKFMGYHYIMVMTPYPFSDSAHENPSVLGSQDGIIWEVPDGVVNPVVGVPFDVRHGGHYSDPFLLRKGDTLEMWFRHTLAVYTGGRYSLDNSRHNRIYRTVTKDLSNWETLETVLECFDGINPFMSVVVMHDGERYRLWYATYQSVLFYIESTDLINWSERVRIHHDLGGLGIWHHDIIFTGEKYEALFISADWGNVPLFRLFYAVSYDAKNFGTGREISIGRISPELEEMTVHKSTFVRHEGIYQMYIAAFTRDSQWRLFYFEIAEDNLHKLFD